MAYLYLDASVRRLFKWKYSPADLMHGPISKSEHSVGVSPIVPKNHKKQLSVQSKSKYWAKMGQKLNKSVKNAV